MWAEAQGPQVVPADTVVGAHHCGGADILAPHWALSGTGGYGLLSQRVWVEVRAPGASVVQVWVEAGAHGGSGRTARIV